LTAGSVEEALKALVSDIRLPARMLR